MFCPHVFYKLPRRNKSTYLLFSVRFFCHLISTQNGTADEQKCNMSCAWHRPLLPRDMFLAAKNPNRNKQIFAARSEDEARRGVQRAAEIRSLQLPFRSSSVPACCWSCRSQSAIHGPGCSWIEKKGFREKRALRMNENPPFFVFCLEAIILTTSKTIFGHSRSETSAKGARTNTSIQLECDDGERRCSISVGDAYCVSGEDPSRRVRLHGVYLSGFNSVVVSKWTLVNVVIEVSKRGGRRKYLGRVRRDLLIETSREGKKKN